LGNPPVQVHDFNPGIRENGLFWTTIVSGDTVDVDLDAGTATLEVADIFQRDFFDFENAFTGNGGTPEPSRVSFRVEWTADGAPRDVDNPVQQYRGTVRSATAQMSWSGRSGDHEFRSAPLDTSTTDAAQIGSCHNGTYYS
jgi:hypothetical protein